MSDNIVDLAALKKARFTAGIDNADQNACDIANTIYDAISPKMPIGNFAMFASHLIVIACAENNFSVSKALTIIGEYAGAIARANDDEVQP